MSNSLQPKDWNTPDFPVFNISKSLLKFLSIESVMPSNHLIPCHPLLLLSIIYPNITSFPMNWLFALSNRSIGASASSLQLPVNIQGWFPLDFTGLISLLSKRLSRVFSSTTIQKYQFFSAQPSLQSNSHMTTGKTIALNTQTFVSKVMSLHFNMLSRFVIVFQT